MTTLLAAVDQAEEKVKHAEQALKDARADRRTAIKAMSDAGMTQREIAKALGLTHGRVAQLVKP